MGAVLVGVCTQVGNEIKYDEIHHHHNDTNSTTPGPGTTDVPEPNVAVVWKLSVTSVYLAGMVCIFLIAAMVHPTEATSVLYGTLYLLCLPGGYLILLIYAFVNLDDRSWGTRTEALRKKETQGVDMLADFRVMLRGCGIWEGEGLLHFAGRLLSCRCHMPPPENEPSDPYAIMAKEELKPNTEDNVWSLSEDGSTALCAPVDQLLAFITEHKGDADLEPSVPELVRLTRAALAACPSLTSWGQWTRCWHSETQNFRIPRGAPTETEIRFWEQMETEITTHMSQNYSWNVVDKQREYQLPDGHRKIGPWLEEIGLPDSYMSRIFLQNGYEDTTFIVDLQEEDLRELGMPSTLTGRANIRKLVEAINKLPRNDIPDSIPPTLGEWLDALCLGVYRPNFERCGYGDSDLALCEGLTMADTRQMGIIKKGHLSKLLKAVHKLTKLLVMGRSPEGKSAALLKTAEIRDLVTRLPESSIEGTYFFPRLVLSDEESFWSQLVVTKMDPKLESISNVGGLKGKLRSLRNVAVIVLFMLNALWILVMVELAQQQSQSLNIFHTNPLGFVFLLVYGSIFLIQFLSMLWHRLSTAIQYIASVPFPARSNTDGTVRHRYAEIQT